MTLRVAHPDGSVETFRHHEAAWRRFLTASAETGKRVSLRTRNGLLVVQRVAGVATTVSGIFPGARDLEALADQVDYIGRDLEQGVAHAVARKPTFAQALAALVDAGESGRRFRGERAIISREQHDAEVLGMVDETCEVLRDFGVEETAVPDPRRRGFSLGDGVMTCVLVAVALLALAYGLTAG